MTNEVDNTIELLHLEQVEFQVKNSIFKNDKMKHLVLKQSNLTTGSLLKLSSNNLQTLTFEDTQPLDKKFGFSNISELVSRQIDL